MPSPTASGASTAQPPGGVWRGNQVEEPGQHRETITSAEAEPGRMRAEGVGEGGWLLQTLADGVRDHLADCAWILTVGEEVSRDAGRTSDGQPAEFDPVTFPKLTKVQPDVGPPGLAPAGKGELVPVGRQVTQPIQAGCGAMGYRALLGSSLPGWNIGGELQPCGPEVEVVGLRCARHPLYARGNPLEQWRARHGRAEPRDGGRRDARRLRLTPRDETPLILCDLAESVQRRIDTACTPCFSPPSGMLSGGGRLP